MEPVINVHSFIWMATTVSSLLYLLVYPVRSMSNFYNENKVVQSDIKIWICVLYILGCAGVLTTSILRNISEVRGFPATNTSKKIS